MPCDFRRVGLHRAAGYILGVDPAEKRPRIVLADDSRPIAEPYVCIAVQSTLQSKYWNNPTGWSEIVCFLKEVGYRVVCIDLKAMHGKGIVWNHMPPGAEDQTGDRPLVERARWLKACRVLYWTLERIVVARLGDAHSGGDDQWCYTPDQRICHALSCDQLSYLQQLLE